MDLMDAVMPSVQPHRTSLFTSTTHRNIFTKCRQHCIAQDASGVTLLYKQQLMFTLSVFDYWENSDSERKKLKGKSTSEKWQQTDAITLLSKNQSPASYKEIVFKTPEHISSTIKIMEERKHSPNLRTFSGTRIV